jgi:hypothetical protein
VKPISRIGAYSGRYEGLLRQAQTRGRVPQRGEVKKPAFHDRKSERSPNETEPAPGNPLVPEKAVSFRSSRFNFRFHEGEGMALFISKKLHNRFGDREPVRRVLQLLSHARIADARYAASDHARHGARHHESRLVDRRVAGRGACGSARWTVSDGA